MEADEAVQSTNDDASECKRCAVKLGYWNDKYIPILVRGSERKPPEINRGYFARTEGVSNLVRKFIKTAGDDCQIVSMGAGFDTLFWRLKDEGLKFSNYTEIDFPTVTAKKCFSIKRSKELLEALGSADVDIRLSSTELHSSRYHLVGADLRYTAEVSSKLKEAEVSFDKPTVFIAECVLVYMEASAVVRLLTWLVEHFNNALFISYEQVNLGDRFGQIMLENLRVRGCPLSGVAACQSLQTQIDRFLSTKWDGAKSWSMKEIYSTIDTGKRQRIERIEMLDEQELLVQLFEHYCMTVAWRGPNLQIFSHLDLSCQSQPFPPNN